MKTMLSNALLAHYELRKFLITGDRKRHYVQGVGMRTGY